MKASIKPLADILGVGTSREALVTDAVRLIESRVAARPGISGLGLRTALAAVQRSRPDILPRACHRLLPEFTAALDPLYRRYQAQAPRWPDFAAFLDRHADEAAGAMLAVADARIALHAGARVKAGYARLRGIAESEVRSAMPEIGKLLVRHLGG